MLLFGAPVVIGLGVLSAGLAWIIAVQSTKGQAKGDWVELQLNSSCSSTYPPILLERLKDYGLEAHFNAEDRLAMQLPGQADDRSHMPIALTRPGKIEAWINGEQHPIHFQDAGVQISFSGTATAVVLLDEHLDPEGLEIRIDGLPVEAEVNDNELQLHITEPNSMDALRQATDWVVALRHPLPCDIRVLDIKDSAP